MDIDPKLNRCVSSILIWRHLLWGKIMSRIILIPASNCMDGLWNAN